MKRETIDRLTKLFYSLKQRGERQFTKQQFFKWHNEQILQGCYYCGLQEKEQQNIIESKILESKRFYTTKNGTRGKHLEIDRKDPVGPYSEGNCVLACYFCNNDKSDIFQADDYKKVIAGNAKYNFLKSLITNNSQQ